MDMPQGRGKRGMRNLANALTGFRLFGAVGLLFLEPLSVSFYLLYTLCGVSDVLDGWAARRSGTASEFGARLDSVADLVFYGVMLLRLFPRLWADMPRPVQLWIGGIVALRLGVYALAAVKFRRFASLHTWLNKATGFAVFAVPYLMGHHRFPLYRTVVCTVATLAAREELAIHLGSGDYLSGCHSLWETGKRTVE